jgi:hypothetical protein
MSDGSLPDQRGVSPASSGPAGPHFEAQVGASYLLAMLNGSEPRGLPGMVIDRIELQRASEGRPLDDVIVHAHDSSGTAAILEIQVKREIAFSPARDRVALALHPDDAAHAATLWTELVELALRVAAAGGDRTRAALLDGFRGRPYRLGGQRRHTSARIRLAEASENALADIDDAVGGAVLLRHERLAEIRAAFDTGRYVEIRGNSGVGKSGLLKHLARQVSAESRVIVLSPVRTTPRGWSHMRAVIEFDGTAPELLADLAQSGGAILFIDNLNRFAEDEPLTVIDMVRAASTVPGVSVVATARAGLADDEPNWLARRGA